MLNKLLFASIVIGLCLASAPQASVAHFLEGTTLDRSLVQAVDVSISGRVKTASGRAISGARIVLRDADTGEVISRAVSSTFGYYKLEQIEAGRMYVLSVVHKRYLFAFPAQLIEPTENQIVDFVGEMDLP